MNEIARRLLELQEEYRNRSKQAGDAAEFNVPEWAPRSEEDIAADYAATLQQFMAAAQ